MTTLGRDADRDALDISRMLIAEAADKASRYANIVLELIEMRDDDAAWAMRSTLVSQVKAMGTAFNALAAARQAEPAPRARAHFQNLGVAPPDEAPPP